MITEGLRIHPGKMVYFPKQERALLKLPDEETGRVEKLLGRILWKPGRMTEEINHLFYFLNQMVWELSMMAEESSNTDRYKDRWFMEIFCRRNYCA